MKKYQENCISIITPVYNAEPFLTETIQCVLDQTYPDWELILIDDASQDQSVSVIESYRDPRIHLLSLPTNSGAAVARNKGLAYANGQYIAFLDSDDRWTSDKLAKQIAFMQEHGFAFTYTDFSLMDESGRMIKPAVHIPYSLDYYALLKNTAIACSTVMIDREIVGDFRMPLVRKGQDTATWLKLMREQNLTAYGLQQVLNAYRQVQGSISSNKFKALKRTWHTYRKLEKLPFFQSCYFFTHYVWQAIKRRL